MTKGQKIIVSLLVVVAIGIVLNLSRGVRGQDILPPRGLPHAHGQDFWNEEAMALDDIRQAIEDASWAAERTTRAMFKANERARAQAQADARMDAWAARMDQQRQAMMNQSPPVYRSPPVSSGSGTLSAQVRAIRAELGDLRQRVEAERVQAAIQRDWVRKRLVRLRQIIEPRFGLPPSAFAPSGPGVVGTRPGHPDTIVQDEAAERDRLREFFETLDD